MMNVKMRAMCQGDEVVNVRKGNYKWSDSSKTSITWKAVPRPDPDLGRRRLEMKLAMAHEEMKSGRT